MLVSAEPSDAACLYTSTRLPAGNAFFYVSSERLSVAKLCKIRRFVPRKPLEKRKGSVRLFYQKSKSPFARVQKGGGLLQKREITV